MEYSTCAGGAGTGVLGVGQVRAPSVHAGAGGVL